jgi:uroporphyrinogen decarboxylase
MKRIADRCNTLAAVSMMDLSVEAEAFGAHIRFDDNEIPAVSAPVVTSAEEAEALQVPASDAARCGLFAEAIRLASEKITDRPVFAGVIGPFSLAGRLMDVSEIMVSCYAEPETVHMVMEKATAFLKEYIVALRRAGANGVLMAEPLTGMLSPGLAVEFSEPYVREIIESVQDDEFAVIYHNCGNNVQLMADSIAAVGAAAYHFGNAVDLRVMLEKMPSDVPVMGNVDPAGELKNGTPESVRAATLQIMQNCTMFPNFVISSGCDIPADSPWSNIDMLFTAANEFYHG